ncbi:MAG: hypothetical protein LQ339_002068 [Xanthoria mediterranea]|nr:MAG: hypothetical protein LQ339_002068 [Xanthoria mediterranea]
MLSSLSSAIAKTFRPLMSSSTPSLPLPNTTHASNLATLFCLSRPSPSRPALPTELILQILAHPTRWLLSRSEAVIPTDPIRVVNKDLPIITLPPFTAEEIKALRRVVFRFRSRDQGYSWDSQNHGTYGGSWTWFEAIIRTGRQDGPDGPASHTGGEDKVKKRFELQRNRHAGTLMESYEIVFDDGDPRMLELKTLLTEGDVLELRACARFPAWMNNVEKAKVEVWSVDDLASRG